MGPGAGEEGEVDVALGEEEEEVGEGRGGEGEGGEEVGGVEHWDGGEVFLRCWEGFRWG